MNPARSPLLSRVAASVYWTGRYLERAEAVARLIRVHTELYLDLPRSAGVGWAPLLAVTGTEEAFAARFDDVAEDDVVRFLAVDEDNPGSVLSSLAAARDNLRRTRATFPGSSWEVLNQLHHWANHTVEGAVDRRSRLSWMEQVIGRCQLLTGLLAGVMSHDAAYAFLEIGRNLERADMTTRVLDVQAGILTGALHDGLSPYADVTWMSVLRSLSAQQMFRRAVGAVSGPEALRFLLKDAPFPRSVEHCLTQISRALLELPRYDAPMAGCAALQRLLEGVDVEALAESGLHEYVDELQLGIAALDERLDETYFFRAAPLTAAGEPDLLVVA
jgi:uncharacterized alpha-E superfamily protein